MIHHNISRIAVSRILGLGFLLLGTSHGPAAADYVMTITSQHDAENVPIRVRLPDTKAAGGSLRLYGESGLIGAAQVTSPGLLDGNDDAGAELHFILPSISANQPVEVTVKPGLAMERTYTWSDQDDKYTDLTFKDGTSTRQVMRYMHEAPDGSSRERLGETYKVYHHVYNPAGDILLTKGAGGLFPHHRGLFFGFNRISYGDGKRADIWHCNNQETQEHVRTVDLARGSVLGRQTLEINWHGQDQAVFARELRELTAYHVPGGSLLEFATRLETRAGPIKLDGDPQHAGFQFRATQHVPDQTRQQTYYLRPDGKGEPGKFRNWPNDKTHVNLPWNALCMVVEGERYTVCYLDRPENPKQSRFSERDYGRFGSYFEYELDEDHPLELNYRIWIQNGEMTVAEVAAHSANFVDPPRVVVRETD